MPGSYHNPPRSIDITIEPRLGDFMRSIAEGLIKLHRQSKPLIEYAGRVGVTHMFTNGGAVFFVPGERSKPRTHAADRTRSKRWQAGSKRTKKLAALARKQGRQSRFADPWSGWTDMGYTTESV